MKKGQKSFLFKANLFQFPIFLKKTIPYQLTLLVIALLVIGGCKGCKIRVRKTDPDVVPGDTDMAFGYIEKPTAVACYQFGFPDNQDNLTEYSFKYIDSSESYTSNLGEAIGAAFRIKVENEHGSGFLGSDHNEMIAYIYVLEFTFPKNGSDRQRVINWSANLQLDASLTGLTNEDGWVWFEWVVMDDPEGQYRIFPHDPYMVGRLMAKIEDTKNYCYKDFTIYPNHLNITEERKGLIFSPPGVRSKLYLGVSVSLRVTEKGQFLHVTRYLEPESALFKVKNTTRSGNMVWFGPEYGMGFPESE